MDTPRNVRKTLKDCESSSDMAAKGKTQNVVSKRQKKNVNCLFVCNALLTPNPNPYSNPS